MKKRVMLCYLTEGSGHHSAALALEQAMRRADAHVETMSLDPFAYANPILAKVVLKTYMSVIKTTPEIWDYLYDNQDVKQKTSKIRELFHRANSSKLDQLLRSFQPHVAVCTQAFSCGVMADWKNANKSEMPLVGVLTDFVAHSYWGNPEVDLYLAPSRDTAENLIAQGVMPERIRVTGIPIRPVFARELDRAKTIEKLDLDPDLPKILVMGGSQGLGPVKSIIRKLDKLPHRFEILAVCGLNKKLIESLENKRDTLTHPLYVFGFVENMDELMDISAFAITKPGGLTTAEALAKRLPLIITRPIPGQEMKNTEFLLRHKVAAMSLTASEVAELAEDFLSHPQKLREMRERMEPLRKPHAAEDGAREILRLLTSRRDALLPVS
jgi:processive 1,2-diacylglycerol beta-glucosyltransferase